MNDLAANQLVLDVLVVLAAGFLSGMICKRIGVSLLVGYLVVGAVIGEGGVGLVSQEQHELEYLARAGALFLLFSVGIEFSLDELVRMRRYFLVGGAVQMLLVTLPLFFAFLLVGMSWKPALLVGAAGALSSTVLVFKALAEWGQSATPHGRRAIGILLFQDVALVPLMLMVPLLTETGDERTFGEVAQLVATSVIFVVAVGVLRRAISRWIVPTLARFRSVELVVLFTLTVLGGVCWCSHAIGLPPSLGALAAGLMLSGNRLSKQIDTTILPFRESFAAVFFVTLGTLLRPLSFFDEPLLLSVGLIGIVLIKSVAATVALKLVGLKWRVAAGMGIGLAQLGEFTFLLVAAGVAQGVISDLDYSRILFIALGTLILTPQLIRLGLRWTEHEATAAHDLKPTPLLAAETVQKGLVIGMGPIGRQIASRLETLGVDVCLVDLSPINLHPFAQQGFHTVTGDAREVNVLHRADAVQSRLAVVCVPDDEAVPQIVRSLRELNRTMFILVRCRFLATMSVATSAGADAVVSEEQQASGALLKMCESVVMSGEAQA